MSPAGSPVREGFEVAEGSEMMGPAFPMPYGYLDGDEEEVDEDAFVAHFVVSDDPREVIGAYLEQAKEEGLTAVDGPACDGVFELPDVVECTGWARTDDEDDPRSMRLSAHLGRVGEARGLSSLEMSYAREPGRWRRVEMAGVGDVLSEVAAAPDDFDEPLDSTTLFAGWPSVPLVDVVEGSRPASQGLCSECADGPLVVLEVTGDGEEVLDAYLEQFAAIVIAEPESSEPVEVAGGRVRDVVVSSSHLSLHAYLFETDGADTPDWMRIGSCRYQG